MGKWDRSATNKAKGPLTITTKIPSTTPNDELAFVSYKDGSIIYACLAPQGSSLDDMVWQIRKIDTSSAGISIQWCDGNSKFDNRATSLAVVSAYPYS
jgi:hypothetical protein